MSLRKLAPIFAVSSAAWAPFAATAKTTVKCLSKVFVDCVKRRLIMSTRKSVLSILVLGAVVAPAFADSGSTFVNGEIGFIWHATPSGKSRDVVRSEFQAFQANPVTADGYRYVGGELGWVYVGPRAGAGKSRDQVRRELQSFQANPVTADGYRYVGGELGWVYVGPKAAR